MTHVLVGYDRYEEIYNRFPTDFWGAGIQHGIGDYREGRKDMLEDYAYFSTYMLTGSLQGADLKKTFIRTFLGSKGPDSIDFPSQEGYAAVVLGALLRGDSEVYTFDSGRGKTDAPVVNASLSDVLGILAKGPRDVNELRQFIDEYLMTKGTSYQYKLPAMLEPLGWSYNGMGSVVDEENKIVTDAYAISISQDGSSEYRSTMSTETGEDGKFYLPKIYPGANILRFFYNADRDSMDFPLTVEWNTVTNKSLELGKFTLKQENIIIPLTLDGYYALTPGIRAQNPLTVTCTGELTTSPGVFAYSYNTSNLLDIQSVAGLGSEMNLNLTIEYTLKNGTTWNTLLSQGDHEDATKATTVLSNPRLRIIGVYGPSSSETKSETTQSATHLDLTLDPPSEKGEYYRADIRLEWDFEQNYYDKDGASAGSESGTTGVYIVHIWRDVSAY